MTWAWVNESSVRSRFVSAKESTLWHTLSSYRTRQAACKPAWFTRDYGYFVFWYIPQSEALLLTSRTQFYVGTVWFCACMAKPVRLSTLWKYCPISPGSYSPMSASALLFFADKEKNQRKISIFTCIFWETISTSDLTESVLSSVYVRVFPHPYAKLNSTKDSAVSHSKINIQT